jgi:hypothetical protein
MDIKYQKAMNEVMQVINYLNPDDRNKIPNNLINYFEVNQCASENTIYPDVPFVDQQISAEGKALLTYINKYL